MPRSADRIARRLPLALAALLFAVFYACRAHHEGEEAPREDAAPTRQEPPPLVPELAPQLPPSTTGAVRLVVIDPDDALRVEAFDVRITRADGSAEERRSPIGGLVAGLAPGDYAFDVRAGDRAPCSLAVRALAAGETRELTALVHRRTIAAPRPATTGLPDVATLSVSMIDADGFTPLANVLVLFRPLFGAAARTSSSTSSATSTARTDATGHIEYRVARGSTFELLARRTPLCMRSVRIDVPLTGPVDPVVVVFGPAGRVAGQLVPYAPADFSRYAVEIRPFAPQASIDDAERFWWEGLDDSADADGHVDLASGVRSVLAQVASDGSFDAGIVPAGDALVSVLWTPRLEPRKHRSSSDVDLANEPRTIARGEQHWTIDLGAHAPGELAVECATDAGTEQLYVELLQAERHTQLAVFALDANGRGAITFLPGRFALRVRARDDAWAVLLPDEVNITARETTRVACSIELTAGTLVLVDATTREPIAGVRVRVHDSESTTGTYATTGARGELALRLPPERYHACIDDVRWADVSFDWRADDAAEREVAVRRLR